MVSDGTHGNNQVSGVWFQVSVSNAAQSTRCTLTAVP